MKLCLIAPAPPPYGGVSNWVRILEQEIRKDSDIQFNFINIAANKRPTDGRNIFDRIFFSGFVMVRAYTAVKKLVRYRKVEVVHMTTSGGLGFYRDILLLKYLKRKKIPTVYHIHFGRTVQYKEKQNRAWRQLLYAVQLASYTITIDQPTYDILKDYTNNISYINNPIDTDSYKKYLVTSEKKIVYLGWMIKEKGIEELLQAFISFNQKRKEKYTLELIGPGEKKYIDYLKNRYPCEHACFCGEMEHDQAMEMLASAEVFILPSYTEGFPNVILEAMTLKKPIIATRVGAIPEMLENGGGILIKDHSVSEIQAALEELIEHKEKEVAVAEKAFRKVLQDYDVKGTYSKYKEIWMSCKKNRLIDL